MLEDEHPDHKPDGRAGPALIGKIGCDLLVQPGPINLISQDYKLVPHVDDLIQPGFEQVVVVRSLLLFWSHEQPQINVLRESQMGQKVIQNRKEMTPKTSLSCNYEYFKPERTVGVSRLSEFFADD
jgi:hypothetical protein